MNLPRLRPGLHITLTSLPPHPSTLVTPIILDTFSSLRKKKKQKAI
jgi:hypothetical protein